MTAATLFRRPTREEQVALHDAVTTAERDLLQALAAYRRYALYDPAEFDRRDQQLDAVRAAIAEITGPLGDRLLRD
jgi:hypothetical protein